MKHKKTKIKPGQISVAGDLYKTVLLRVIDRNNDGTPRTVMVHYDHDPEKIKLDQDEPTSFWIVYVPKTMTEVDTDHLKH